MADIKQIRVNGNLVGIVGLQKIMEGMAADFADRSDEEIGKEILRQTAQYNYIPRRAEKAYADALIKEFRRFLGQEVAEEPPSGLQIIVLGPGCARCTQLESDVREALAELQLPGEMIHVDDLRSIARYGVMGTPALIVNGKVVSAGTTPTRQKIKEWLQAAETSMTTANSAL
ncbi:MAG TPA: thioredoxin family protein [Syntrophales bacterium]|jgi:small redox-active disulfide protein 2|nr:thioredoxin family protein [Syntrophales bacterium]HOU77435.1 thioredoxin family protein [Syntrophales bacterium]HQI36839.1 thioredoxin family protein [Syntrophales bacterium]HQJ31687.1 thioredoxin family protein [Syntrophales bacterium]HRR47818.1 thioredoxin family protein [Syntrophales bacterium]